jgi:hypothetical protein
MNKQTKTIMLSSILISLLSLATAIATVNAATPITWGNSKTVTINGNQFLIVERGGNLYYEAHIYKYTTNCGWAELGYFTVQVSTTWYGTVKATATANLCYKGYCYPVKTLESSLNVIEYNVKQYIQNFYLALQAYSNVNLAAQVYSLIMPYMNSMMLGMIGGTTFIAALGLMII